MQRLIIVYNPNSSQYIHVRDDVLDPISKFKSVMIGKFAIKKAPFEDNLKALKKILKNNDLVIAAGGDATAAVATNAILESGRDITLAVLPYGNFNDLARTLGTMKLESISDYVGGTQNSFLEGGPEPGKARSSAGRPWRWAGRTRPEKKEFECRRLYPLEVYIDGKHWRYATCYVTIGMTAEAVELFDDPKIRKKMKEGHRSSWRSYLQLAKWYFKNRRKRIFIPKFKLNGKLQDPRVSDCFATNGRSMARVMKGGNDYLTPEIFHSKTEKMTNLLRLFMFMSRSILLRVPGSETKGDLIEFLEPATVEIQAEGEYKVFKNIQTVEIKKSNKFIKVIHG